MGGITPIQAMEIVRGCRGLNLIGADIVEVAVIDLFCLSFCLEKLSYEVTTLQVNPLYDPSGVTANMAANLLFEMLCVLPGVKYIDPPTSNFDF